MARQQSGFGRFGLLLAIAVVGTLADCGGGAPNPDPPTSPSPPTDTLSGTVTFKGNALSGATITAFDTNSNAVYQTATTDANGNYSFAGIRTFGNVPIDYQFWVNKPGYGFYPAVGSGGRVTRADYTGQFAGNGITDIAIYFTVVDYLALPNSSVSGADFTAYNGSNPRVSVANTGQQASYFFGDDASQRRGVAWSAATRFTDNQDGTVSDSLTGLTWLKNAGCFSPTTWADALTDVHQLASGACGLTDGSSAGEWRLPNLDELESLVDVSTSNPALPTGNPFTNASNSIYWSSTSYFGGQGGSANAWAIRLSDGRYMNDGSSNLKATASNAVWAVEGNGGGAGQLQATGAYVVFGSGDDASIRAGVPLTYPRWIDNGNGTVTDTVTGLIWLKQADCIRGAWTDAITAVDSLANGQCGLTDGSIAGSWRMPNRNEMQSLADRMENNHADFFDQAYTWKANQTLYQAAIFTNFIAFQYYWTSTTDAADVSEAWTVFSCDFGVYDTPKSEAGYTLAVR